MISLDFSQPVQQTIVDKDGQGTGFSSIQPNSLGNEYNRSNLDLDTATGVLRITTQTGSNTASNDLKNALQVPVSNVEDTFTVATRIMGPFSGFSKAYTQGGVFIGVNQDTYVKLVVVHTGGGIVLQFFREENGVRSQIAEVRDISWANVTNVELYLEADKDSNTITARFKTNLSSTMRTISVPFTPVANSPLFLPGVQAGILTSSPTAGQIVSVPFDIFQLNETESTSPLLAYKAFDFTTSTATLPSGYIREIGSAYNESVGYGWVNRTSKSPVSVSNGIRERGTTVDKRLDTIAHMQYQGTNNAWELAVPNGRYSVRVGVGDPLFFDSTHSVLVEGQPIVSGFKPSSAQKFMILSRVVIVTDGKLTLDSLGGTNVKVDFVQVEGVVAGNHPSVEVLTTTNDESGKPYTDTSITADLSLPNGSLTTASVNNTNVTLYETASRINIPSAVNTSGGGDVIALTPVSPLKPNTSYTYEVSSGVKDSSGTSILPHTYTFLTSGGSSNSPGGTGSTPGGDPTEPGKGNGVLPTGAANVSFSREILTEAGSDPFSSLLIGPDGRLYATTLDGKIHRWTIVTNGTLTNKQTFAPTKLAGKALVGLVFEPDKPDTIWITYNDGVYPQPAPDFTSAIAKLTITSNSETTWSASIQDYVVKLPRAAKDHLSNSLAFKNGLLYLSQGSTSAMGAPDAAWYNRPERLLAGAILEIDPTRTTNLPINVQTERYTDSNGVTTTGSYNPAAINAPVKIYASGVRNAYDLVWHSNGNLYVPTNGSAAGGNTPDNPATSMNEGLTKVSAENDWLFKVEEGGYYGHPNPKQGYFILNGGNPTSGYDPGEIVPTASYTGYSIGTQPEDNYRGYVMNFGIHRSPNGAIEYKGNNALKGALLVTEYSAGDDIVAVFFKADGNVAGRMTLVGGFVNPLDIAQDANGNLYVCELNEDTFEGRISISRVQ